MADRVGRGWGGIRLRWVALLVFGAGFGFVEAAVVSYLRRIIGYQPGYHVGARTVYVDLGFITFVQPDRSVLVDPGLTQVETAREAATLVMLMGLFAIEGVARVGASSAGRHRGLPMMEVLTPPIWKTSTCLTLPSLALT